MSLLLWMGAGLPHPLWVSSTVTESDVNHYETKAKFVPRKKKKKKVSSSNFFATPSSFVSPTRPPGSPCSLWPQESAQVGQGRQPLSALSILGLNLWYLSWSAFRELGTKSLFFKLFIHAIFSPFLLCSFHGGFLARCGRAGVHPGRRGRQPLSPLPVSGLTIPIWWCRSAFRWLGPRFTTFLHFFLAFTVTSELVHSAFISSKSRYNYSVQRQHR